MAARELGHEECPHGSGVARIWMGTPWLGVAVVQLYKVKLLIGAREAEIGRHVASTLGVAII